MKNGEMVSQQAAIARAYFAHHRVRRYRMKKFLKCLMRRLWNAATGGRKKTAWSWITGRLQKGIFRMKNRP